MTRPPAPPRTAAIAGWSLLFGFAIAGGALGNIYDGVLDVAGTQIHRVRLWQMLYLAGCVGYFTLLWTIRARPVSWRMILVAAVLLRIPLVWAQPNNDCNRYIWEGRIQRLGFNPFVAGPEDPALEPHRDAIWESINKKHYTTIYPPLAQLEYRLLAGVRYAVKSPQVAHTLLDVAVCAALAVFLRRRDRAALPLAAYALCPLVLASFAHAGHNDTLMLLPLVGGLAAASSAKWVRAGGLWGAAILCKIIPIVMVPLMLRRSRIAVVVAVIVVAAGYALYLDAGWKVFETLYAFPAGDRFNNPIHEWLSPIAFASTRNAIAMAIIGLAAIWRFARPADIIDDARFMIALLIVLSPVVHFWYFTWIIVPAMMGRSPRWYWLAVVPMQVFYWNAEYSGQIGTHWHLENWALAVMWLPVLAALAADVRLLCKSTDAAAAPSRPHTA